MHGTWQTQTKTVAVATWLLCPCCTKTKYRSPALWLIYDLHLHERTLCIIVLIAYNFDSRTSYIAITIHITVPLLLHLLQLFHPGCQASPVVLAMPKRRSRMDQESTSCSNSRRLLSHPELENGHLLYLLLLLLLRRRRRRRRRLLLLLLPPPPLFLLLLLLLLLLLPPTTWLGKCMSATQHVPSQEHVHSFTLFQEHLLRNYL